MQAEMKVAIGEVGEGKENEYFFKATLFHKDKLPDLEPYTHKNCTHIIIYNKHFLRNLVYFFKNKKEALVIHE